MNPYVITGFSVEIKIAIFTVYFKLDGYMSRSINNSMDNSIRNNRNKKSVC